MSEPLSIDEAWARIEAWLGKKGKRIAKRLAPGASDEALAKLEAAFGQALPEAFKASWRRHDGAPESDLFPATQDEEMGFSPLPLEQIAQVKLIDGDSGKRRLWLPIASNGGGDYQCIDLAPADNAQSGRVIECNHETNSVTTIAASLADLLTGLAIGLEKGAYKLDSDCGIIRPHQVKPGELRQRAFALLASDTGQVSPRRPEPPEGARAIPKLDPERQKFGPATSKQYEALRTIGVDGEAMIFFEHYAPRSPFEIGGVTFQPVNWVVGMNGDHCTQDAKYPLVFAVTAAGAPLALMVHDGIIHRVFLFSPEEKFAGVPARDVAKRGKRIADHVWEFLEKLAAGTLDLTPKKPKKGGKTGT